MTAAAELALETLVHRNELLSKEGPGIEFETFEEPRSSG
jgi:hypothetical protein